MSHYDEQLSQLQAQCARKKKLEAAIAELRTQRDTYTARAKELEQVFREEQADVDRLEERNLSAFFYNVIGKMDEKLTQEKQEAYAARVKYDAVARELAGIEEDLRRCEAKLHSLYDCESRYAAVKLEKTQAVKVAGGDTAEKILNLEERVSYLKSQERELKEAVAAGQDALATAEQIADNLNSAENWGIWDLAGGGLFAKSAVTVKRTRDEFPGIGACRRKNQRLSADFFFVRTTVKCIENGSFFIYGENVGRPRPQTDV